MHTRSIATLLLLTSMLAPAAAQQLAAAPANDATARVAARTAIFRENPFLIKAVSRVGGFGNLPSTAIANRMYSRTHAPALADAANLLQIEPQGVGTWVLRFPWVNVVVFETSAGLVLIDSGYAPAGPALRDALRRLSRKRVHTIVYTHHHIDHMLGSWALLEAGERPRIVATRVLLDEVDADLRSRGFTARLNNQTLAEFPRSRADLPMPTRVFDHKLVLNIGRDRFELTHAPGETQDQLWVWVPTRQVVVAADYFQPFLPNAGNGKRRQRFVDSWAKALRDMAALNPQRAFLMHGPPMTNTAEIVDRFTAQARMLESIADQTLERLNAGIKKYDAANAVQLPAELSERGDAQPLYVRPPDIARMVAQQYSGWWSELPSEWTPAPKSTQAREIVSLAGGLETILQRAESLAGTQPALACHLADWAWLAEPTNPRVLATATRVYLQRLRDEEVPTQEAIEYVEHLITLRVTLDRLPPAP
ncbi:MAG: MBL fold metallo-hydrolase [Gammaproteobacteria bacterium]|nr:MBL fold metallo-hydrolase [Gammaproteobacteria bacterium]